MSDVDETAAPTTSPQPPRRPLIPGPVETAVIAWRSLRRMSTALLLLFALATATTVATVVPQQPVTARTVADWRSGAAGPGRSVAGVLDALGLFDIFGSWWFATLTVLLFVSLTGCLVPRYRAFLRTARRPPAAGRNLARLSHHVTVQSPLPGDAALAAADRLLRRRRFRRRLLPATDARPAQLAAERGHWREGGSLLFHTAFYLILIGAVIGQTFGFRGQIGVVEGGSFADTRIAYDFAQPGRAFGVDDHRGFVATLDDFDVTYFDDFTPREFVSTVTLQEPDGQKRIERIRVNHPLRYRGMTLYQLAFGFAPRLVVKAGDQVLVDEPVLLAPGGSASGNVWTGTSKIRIDDVDQQLALDLVLAPDARRDANGQPVVGPDPRATNPVLVAALYFGPLGLERPIPASQFDRSGGAAETVMLRPGERRDLADGNLTVEFTDLPYWSGLQVSHQPGRLVLLAGAILLLIGLVPSLYAYRRRVWVEVTPVAEGGSSVTLAGVALHRKALFDDAFASLADSLQTAVKGHRSKEDPGAHSSQPAAGTTAPTPQPSERS